MTFLSLFSGLGGIDLGLERAGMRCVGQVECDPFCLAVLAKHWPDVPRFNDVRTFDVSSLREPVDLVAGGFPCQDISVAGKGAGIEGDRSGLWREMYRIIGECGPRWVLVENVPALRNRGADRVLGMLALAGYSCRALVVGAWAVGAPHRRNRAWIIGWRVADADGDGVRQQRELAGGNGAAASVASGDGVDDAADGRFQTHAAPVPAEGGPSDARSEHAGQLSRGLGRSSRGVVAHAPLGGQRADGGARRDAGHADERGADVADAPGERRQGPGREHAGAFSAVETLPHAARWPARPGEPQRDWEAPRLVEFPLGGAVDGVPARLVRLANRNALRAFGNSVVPQIPELIGRLILASPPPPLGQLLQLKPGGGT